MIIQKASEEDRSTIAHIFAQAFYKDWELLSKDSEVIASAIESGLNIQYYLVAKMDEQVVGFLAYVEKEDRAFQIILKSFQKAFGFFRGYMMGMAMKSEFETSLHLRDDEIYIDIVGVAVEAQGKGIATALLQYVVDHTLANMYTLTVTNINTYAQRCYTNIGFREYDRKAVKYAKYKGFSEMLYMKYTRI